MFRARLAGLMMLLFACTEQNDPGDSLVSGKSDDITLEDNPPDGELVFTDLDLAASHIEAHTPLSGGATTIFDDSEEAFDTPAANLHGEQLERHLEADESFELEHEEGRGPAGGLGPLFDNVSCEECHVEDGRGRPPIGAEPFSTMLFRGSVAGRSENGGPKSAPGFGTQLQMQASPGFQPEMSAVISYVESRGTFADGGQFSLRVPTYRLTGIYASLPASVLFSPRVAPAVIGLGLLEAVPEADIVSRADIHDRNGDGISGKPNYVWDVIKGRQALGRFGWKANTPNLVQQAAAAYNGDMGVTSRLFPAESCEGQDPRCGRHAPEISRKIIDDVAFYTQTLAVPARRDLEDPKTRRGERLFYAVGCNDCHTPTLRTGTLRGVPEVSNQVIHPYTDLLVHNMGPGLADGRADFLASGSEWRTPPLWGIGLVQEVNGHTNFLHDGRARSLMEAILWHGGEGTAARNKVTRLPKRDRDALIAFLRSL